MNSPRPPGSLPGPSAVPTATLRTHRSQETKEKLIAAVIELLAEECYRTISLLDIEERSGVSRGSIPWHFGTKEGLLQNAVQYLREDAEERFSAEAPEGAEGAEGARWLAARAALAIRGPRGRARLSLLFEAIDPDSPIHDSFATIHGTARAYYRRWLERPAVVTGLPRGTDLDELAAIVFGAIAGINQQWLVDPDAFDLSRAHLTLFCTLFPYLDWDAPTDEPPERTHV